MEIHGHHLIGSQRSRMGKDNFTAFNPRTGEALAQQFSEATESEIDQAVVLAQEAFQSYRSIDPEKKADFLDAIADEIEALGDVLAETASLESGLPLARFTGERGRTTFQLRLFAKVVREGSWVEARIDHGNKEKRKPDLRQIHIPLGPVGIFGASNFPLAFSVAGGDTASALAAGCPVLVKGHPAHPATSELVGRAIVAAAEKTGMPEGVFSLVQGRRIAVGMGIVNHPLIKAIGFTGSLRGGRAIFDAASQRPEPIPVFAEMGSTNPVFILPEAMKERGSKIASSYAKAVTLGVGQFCTNPGMVFGLAGEQTESFIQEAGQQLAAISPGTMLTKGIQESFVSGIDKLTQHASLVSKGEATETAYGAASHLLTAPASQLLDNPDLADEVFGPSSIIFQASNKEELLAIARNLEGHLTTTLHGNDDELLEYADLIAILEQKVGRLIVNGYPTGVEVAHAMVHGGPYPATTDSRSTSVGTGAIKRFARPVCYQNFPEALMPPELHDSNPRGIMRMVDGNMTR